MKNPGPDGLYPYAGSSGWSGTDTSKAAADKDDAEGRTLRRHQLTMFHLDESGPYGWTVKELRDAFPEDHHGRWSAALSRAHRMGAASLLAEQRIGCHVYVSTGYVNDRATVPYRPRRLSRAVRRELTELAEAGDLEGILEYLADGPSITTNGHQEGEPDPPVPPRRVRRIRRRPASDVRVEEVPVPHVRRRPVRRHRHS